MNVCKSTIVWSAVLIILSCNVDVDAAKASRRGGTKQKTPNYDHVALTYGHGQAVKNTHHKPVQHQQVHQVHQTQSHHQPVAPIAPSAPVLPPANTNNNKPVGWNVPHNAPEQPKTVSNTHSALPYPQNPPPYAPNPPPYAQNTGFNAHPQAAGPPPAYPSHAAGGPPPAYSPNPSNGFNAHPADHPPAYQHGSAYPSKSNFHTSYLVWFLLYKENPHHFWVAIDVNESLEIEINRNGQFIYCYVLLTHIILEIHYFHGEKN